MTIDLIFNSANLFVLPLWVLMIFLPNWKVTRKVMESWIPLILLVPVYLYLIISSINPEFTTAVSNPTLSNITIFFGGKLAVAAEWLHLLVLDLFVGRWIYWEGQRTNVWTTHSIFFGLFSGPLALLSHVLTSWISQKFFSDSIEETTSTPTV